MNNENLTWSDITSPTMTPEEYHKKFADKEIIQENFKSYNPKTEVIHEISEILATKNETVKVLALGAAWCKDCTIQVPRLLKIARELSPDLFDLHILYGIKTNPYRKPNEIRWSARHSPQEAVNPKFAANKIPMIYFFNKSGELMGIIEESPTKYPTIEEVLLSFIK